MGLSHDLVSQFAKIVNKDTKKPSETTVYGTVVTDGEGNKYVKLDGSDQLTPITNTSSSVNADERVSVLIKDHSATVTGNLSSPSVRTGDFDDLNDQVTDIKKFDLVLADRVEANEGYIQNLQADKANVGDLTAATARITELETKKASIEELNAAKAEITDLKTTKIDAEVANAKYATIENLTAATGEIDKLQAKNVNIENILTSHNASITNLETNMFDAESGKIKFASIDFSNIGMAAVEQLFTKSGIIKDLVAGDTIITGELVGVTIKGDLIEGNTIKADKLVVKGSDGLFYKLNVDALGETTASSDEKYQNGLDGSVIVANSITAEKVNVKDLVAFGATIGGFHITDDSLYSGAKASADNTTRGIFLGDDGQFTVGDQNNFLKFYKDTDGTYKLAISAASMIFSSSGSSVESVVSDAVSKADTAKATADAAETKAEAAETAAKATFKSVDVEYYLSDYATSLSGGNWQSTAPEWQNGKYIWSRTKVTDQNNNVSYKPNANGVCITGNTGSKGDKGDTGATGPQGEQGEKGATGVGVSSILEQYYLSTSYTEQTGGSWSSDQPEWSTGKYIWTRSYITWSDNSTSTTDPVLAEALNGANAKAEDANTRTDQVRGELKDSIDAAKTEIDERLEGYVDTGTYEDDRTEIDKNINDKFDEAANQTQQVQNDVNDRFNDIATYIRFDEDGIELGKDGNPRKLRIDHDSIKFTDNEEAVSEWDGENFHTGNIKVDVLERAQFGNFAFVPRSDGSLAFLKVDNVISGNLFNNSMWALGANDKYEFIGTAGIKVSYIEELSRYLADINTSHTKKYRLSCFTKNVELYICEGERTDTVTTVDTEYYMVGDGQHTIGSMANIVEIIVTAAKEYTLLATKPTDWDSGSTNYYIKDDRYNGFRLLYTGQNRPTWEANKYYSAEYIDNTEYYLIQNIKLVEVG